MRKHLSWLLIGLLAFSSAHAELVDIVTKGSVDRSVPLTIIDSTDGTNENAVVFNTSGIDLWYRREGAARVAVTEVTLAALTTAHTDGGFLYVSDGEYRLDLPDAAFATGANYVDFGGTVTGMIVKGGRVRLIDASLEVANLAANVTQVSGDSVAADNLETAFDDTAGAVSWQGIVDQGTAQAATSTTLQLRSAAAFADSEIIGATCVITGGSAGVGQARTVTAYVSSTDTATVGTWTTTPTGTIAYKCYGTAASSGGSGGDATAANQTTILANLATIDDFIDTEIAAIKTKTDFLPSATAGAAGGVFIAGTNAATTVTTSFTTTFTGNLSGSVGSVATGGITAASIATDAIGAAEIASDAGTEIAAAVAAIAITEPAAKPAWGGSLSSWVAWIGAWSRNEINQTSSSKALRNDADNANIVTCAVSDNGTTFELSECTP